jgi:hypothetical protein
MRVFFATLLLLGSCLSAHYSHGQDSQAGTAANTHISYGTAYSIPLGPAPNQRLVKPEYIIQEPTYYLVTLPVLRDKDGQISLTVVVNPQTHSVQKLDALLVPLNEAVTYRQIGKGASRYDAPTGRYYFNTIYQTSRKLPNGYTDNGSGRVITGWVKPGTSQAAVADEVIP